MTCYERLLKTVRGEVEARPQGLKPQVMPMGYGRAKARPLQRLKLGPQQEPELGPQQGLKPRMILMMYGRAEARPLQGPEFAGGKC
jgi:hypothetical protein